VGKVLKDVFQTPYFRVVVVPDEETVELCGALKVSPVLCHNNSLLLLSYFTVHCCSASCV